MTMTSVLIPDPFGGKSSPRIPFVIPAIYHTILPPISIRIARAFAVNMAGRNIPTVDFNGGVKMPLLGLGTWKGKDEEMERVVKEAIDLGYRHIDTAWVYENEKGVGAGIAAKIADGTVKREDLFIVTKLWNKFHDPADVEKMCRESLSNLRLDYVDLYLIHWPVAFKNEGDGIVPRDEKNEIIFSDDDYVETYKAMEALVEKGLVKAIGLSNFNSEQIQRILDVAKVKPVVNQVESHPWLNQNKLNDWCNEKEIHLTAYSPLGSPDRPWAKEGEPNLLEDPNIKAIGEKYGKTNAQVLIKYQLQRGLSVIPKSVSSERMAQNMDVLDFELSAEDMDKLNSMDKGPEGRALLVPWFAGSPHYPHTPDVEF